MLLVRIWPTCFFPGCPSPQFSVLPWYGRLRAVTFMGQFLLKTPFLLGSPRRPLEARHSGSASRMPWLLCHSEAQLHGFLLGQTMAHFLVFSPSDKLSP
jgi:hypothetical protein